MIRAYSTEMEKKEVNEPRLEDTAHHQRGPNKRKPKVYQLVSKKVLHMRPPSHSSVSPSQKSDTSADSSDSSSDGIPTKETLKQSPSSRKLLKSSPSSPQPQQPGPQQQQQPQQQPRVENILSPNLPEIITFLLTTYGLPSHAGFIDPSFSIYLPAPTASYPANTPEYAISFKTCHGVAVMYGDPLCAPDQVGRVFDSFCAYAKRRKWRVTVIGATSRLVDHAVNRAGWGAMEFAVASVLNPTTDVIAVGKGFQTIRRDNRRLTSAGWKVEVYDPSSSVGGGRSLELEAELSGLYKEWREERNARGIPQTYSTVLEPWLVPGACRHLYVRSPDTGKVAGLATMLRCGGVDGYLLDPLLAVAGSPRGVTEILTTHALKLLQDEGATYLTFGFAPLMSLGSILNVPSLVEKPSRICYAKLQEHLGLGGKKIWHEKWRPERSEGNWLLFPPGGVTGYLAVTRALCGVTHIRLKDVVGKPSAESSKGKGNGKENGKEGEDHKQASGTKGVEKEQGDHKLANGRKGAEKEQEQVGKSEVANTQITKVRYSCMPWNSASPRVGCYWPGWTLRSIFQGLNLEAQARK